MPLAAHSDFIKEQLPNGISQADPLLLKALRVSLLKSNHSRHDLKEVMDALQNPAAFAKPLLHEAIKKEFPHVQDIESIVFKREWKNSHLLGLIKNHAATTHQSLLEAALLNFEASEGQPGGMASGTTLNTPTKKGPKQAGITAAEFANLCRRLDLGKQYQEHIATIVDPPATPGLTRTTKQVQRIFSEHGRNTFEVALHIAYVQKQIEKALYDDLLILLSKGQHPSLRCSHLAINHVVMAGVWIIGDSDPEKDQILYIPEDPIQALRKHTSKLDLENTLAERLKEPDYAKFFNTLYPLKHHGSTFTVREPYWSSSGGGTPVLVTPSGLNEPVIFSPIQGDLFEGAAEQWLIQIKDNARTLAVPTADADAHARQKRRQHYIDTGKSVLFFAMSFIPLVGEVLLVVAGIQLINSVYNGFAAWSRNDSDQALDELLNVIDDIALAAATAGAIKTTNFTASLIKVRLANGGYRLWNPSLVPYRQLKPYPDGTQPDTRGLYHHEQQHYLELDDLSHVIKRDPQSQQWRLQHPTDPQAYTPPLLSNGVGGWRCEHENPYDWDEFKLIKRLGPDAKNITEPMVEPIFRLSGVDATTLREAHHDAVRPPPALRDTVKRFNWEKEIDNFTFERALGTSLSQYSPLIQFYLTRTLIQLTSLKELNITQDQESHSDEQNTDINVPESRLIKGELLDVLEEQMQLSEFEALLPEMPSESISNIQRLAKRLHEEALEQKHLLLMWLEDYTDSPGSKLEYDIRKIMPLLSKSHLEEMTAVLNKEQAQRIMLEQSLTPQQHWEASQYVQEKQARRAVQNAYLNNAYNISSLRIILNTLEKLPGWPTSLRIEIRDTSINGKTLGILGPENAPKQYLLIRKDHKYAVHDAVAGQLHAPTDLFSAIEKTLSTQAFDITNADTLERTVQRALLHRAQWQKPLIRNTRRPVVLALSTGHPLDPLFAEPKPPAKPFLRGDNIYQSQPQPDGTYRYYILQDGKYYQVKSNTLGWQLIDARSRFRAYRPYINRNAKGYWEIDKNKGLLLGGMDDQPIAAPPVIAPHAHVNSTMVLIRDTYTPNEINPAQVPYTAHDLAKMRSRQTYAASRNYSGHYDRINNGRYPIRDMSGQPMRIKYIESSSTSDASNTTYYKETLEPYLKWQGYEKVASLYDEKIEVVPFTAALQKFPEESSLLGQKAVVAKRAIHKGEPLGIYGGTVLHESAAQFRQDVYASSIEARSSPPPDAIPHIRKLPNTELISGDNVLSRINTIFEYETGRPVRQARTGYNTESVDFDVDTIDNSPVDIPANQQTLTRLKMTAFFASEDIAAGDELRWNYNYGEQEIREYFSES